MHLITVSGRVVGEGERVNRPAIPECSPPLNVQLEFLVEAHRIMLVLEYSHSLEQSPCEDVPRQNYCCDMT